MLDELNELVVDNLRDILDEFGIDYVEYYDRLSFPCPIHGSDNDESLSVFINGHSIAGNWRCWTKECENSIVTDTVDGKEIERPLGKNIFGLIRGLMSVEEDRHVEYSEAINWCKKFLKFSGEEETSNQKEQKQFVNMIKVLTTEPKKINLNVPRDKVVKSLSIPAKYYIDRGYKKETIEKYDVGLCRTKGKKMNGRIVVPVYDDSHSVMVGCFGRTINPKCDKCGKYHLKNTRCPQTKFEKVCAAKWKNEITSGSYLYNSWFAKNRIKETGVAILVEGPGDVWRLEEAGIKNGIGIFGVSLSEAQMNILNRIGAMTLVIALDNDGPGQAGIESIKNKYSHIFNIIVVDLNKNDIGEMSIEEVEKLLGDYK